MARSTAPKVDWNLLDLDKLEQHLTDLAAVNKKPTAAFTRALTAARQAAATPEPVTDDVDASDAPDPEEQVAAEAAQAEAEASQDPADHEQPAEPASNPEPAPADTDPAAADFDRRVKELVDAGHTEEEAIAAVAEVMPSPAPARDVQPYALIDTVAKPITYYWAKVTICVPNPDGGDTTEVICDCKYGHEREDLALKCARKIAGQHGARIA